MYEAGLSRSLTADKDEGVEASKRRGSTEEEHRAGGGTGDGRLLSNPISPSRPTSRPGVWIIREALAYMIFGDPEKRLFDRFVSFDEEATRMIEADDNRWDLEHSPGFHHFACESPLKGLIERARADPLGFGADMGQRAADHRRGRDTLEMAERTLKGDLQIGRLIPYGIRQPGGTTKPLDGDHVEIPRWDLMGDLIFNSPLDPPSESWVRSRDPDVVDGHKAWRRVRLDAAEVMKLHPTPLACTSAPDVGMPMGAISACGERSSPNDVSAPDEHHLPGIADVDERFHPTRPASDEEVHCAITAVYDHAKANSMKPPNLKELVAPVKKRLQRKGLKRTVLNIQDLADDPCHKAQRGSIGSRLYGSLLPFTDVEI